jgi:hypothetical protein
MRQITLAIATLATLTLVSAAQADSYYGPRQAGNQCWKTQGHNSLGYWVTCPTQDNGRSAQASGRRTSR